MYIWATYRIWATELTGSPAQPDGKPGNLLHRGVRVEHRETQDSVRCRGHEQASEAGVCAQVEHLVQVAGEDLTDEPARVPGVGGEHDAADRLVIGLLAPRMTSELFRLVAAVVSVSDMTRVLRVVGGR